MTARPTSMAWEKLAYARSEVRDLKALVADLVKYCVGKTLRGMPAQRRRGVRASGGGAVRGGAWEGEAMRLKVKLTDGAPLPRHAKPGDAGLDLTTREELNVRPHETVMVHTGVAVELPRGYYAAVVPRSGIASKRGLAPINSPGTIDSDYRGEVLVPLHNYTDVVQHVDAGERICQLIVQRHETCECVEVDELGETDRGEGGFGSTGVCSIM